MMAMGFLAVIRIRGQPSRRPEERKTLELLRLHKVFHCVLVPDAPDIRGMLKVVEYAVTYGEVSKEVLAELLEKRGRVVGGKPLTLDYLKGLGYGGFEELVEALIEGKAKLPEGVKPVFRLHPPKGGFKGSVKKHYREGGELGYRSQTVNELLKRMM